LGLECWLESQRRQGSHRKIYRSARLDVAQLTAADDYHVPLSHSPSRHSVPTRSQALGMNPILEAFVASSG
jgi:hypothetical protein